MTSPRQSSSLPLAESKHLIDAVPSDDSALIPSVNLVFTQDAAGHFLSFCWQGDEDWGCKHADLVGQLMSASAGPVAIAPFLKQVQHVLNSRAAVQVTHPFCFGDQYGLFDLLISPVLRQHEPPSMVVVMGKLLQRCPQDQALQLAHTSVTDYGKSQIDQYHKLLTKVAWNIRRTLDLETIWQQTVDGLGQALEADRCIICPYKPDRKDVQVVAEHRQPALESMLGQEIDLEIRPCFQQALATLRPVAVGSTEMQTDGSHLSLLILPTCYQDQPNGLIILYQFDRSRLWSDLDIELVQEFTDQVGTGIAHASLFAESQELAEELRRANASLVQKHQELEEAHQQAEEASRLKSEFLANTSHELRTPLNGMIGFLKLIMDGMADDPEEQNDFIQEAYRSAVHLLDIINDILDIAKIEAGKMQLDVTSVKLDDLLTEVENFIRPQAHQKHLSFEIRTPAVRDEVILIGNYQRLKQVMLNLVGNAIKFTHEGGVTISAEVIQEQASSNSSERRPGIAKISVGDTGIGVSLEKQDKLFQSFSQLDGSRTRQYGGTGLGLAISQRLVEAMGGVVNFFSMGEGLGSTVTFTVPLYQDPVMISAEMPDAADLLN